MCYNCGCGMPNNDMGKPENITNKTFDLAADAMDLSDRRSKENALDLLRNVLASDEQSTDKNWKPQPTNDGPAHSMSDRSAGSGGND